MEGAATVVDLDVRMWCCSFNMGARKASQPGLAAASPRVAPAPRHARLRTHAHTLTLTHTE